MALKLDYVVRETSTNMRRNVTLTIAAIVTMAMRRPRHTRLIDI